MTERIDRRILDVVDALHGSFDLREVIRAVHDELRVLIPADIAAICLSRPGGTLYDWFTSDCPAAFFEEYPSFAASDFVAAAVKRQANCVVLDDEMAPRRAIESSLLYRRSHELGLPFEQAMSVLVQCEQGHGGITLYRTRRSAFSETERHTLQLLVRPLAHAIMRSRRFGHEAEVRDVLAACLAVRAGAVVVFDESGRELLRSAGLIDIAVRWFAIADRGSRGFTENLDDWRRQMAQLPAERTGAALHRRSRGIHSLKIHGERLRSSQGRRYVALFFAEHAANDVLPPDLAAKLTRRQREVAVAILRGWDNRLIASELRCAVDTVKQHAREVFARLGVESRVHLHVLVHGRNELP